ncbi:hypothetical protein F4780DRAFT_26034 [Xylariomycetidae sp. FL0641]|nr:hypothetical protein F4780DRAFT_26034 [Xylariomycetidae sp. FL0641]
MPSPPTISDGWEDLDDDNLSVVSLPESEDGILSPKSTTPPRPTESPSRAQPIEGLISLPIRPKHATPQQPTASDAEVALESPRGKSEANVEVDSVERYGMDTKDTIEPEERTQKEPESLLGDILDVEINPTYLHQVTTSLVKLITEILGDLKFKQNHRQDFELFFGSDEIQYECEILHQHLNALEPILKFYAKQWRPEGDNVEIPIDPGIYEWLASLRIELLGLQANVQAQLSPQASSSATAWKTDDSDHYRKAFTGFSDQIKSFMPVIRRDYEESHARLLPVVSTRRGEPSTVPRNGQGPRINRMPPGNSLCHLRRELYALKDQISACIEEYVSNRGVGIANDNGESAALTKVMASFRSMKSSLDVMLSNHASNWLDHSLEGGLTYPEFCRLNPDTMRSLNLQLKDLVEDLFLARRKAESARYINDPDSVLDVEVSVVKKSTIEGLQSVEEILASLLQRTRPAGGRAPAGSLDQLLDL